MAKSSTKQEISQEELAKYDVQIHFNIDVMVLKLYVHVTV